MIGRGSISIAHATRIENAVACFVRLCYNKFMTQRDRQIINDCIEQIARGNQDALERLSCLVSARLLSVAQSVVKSRAVAEDVVQDSFVLIYKNAAKFRRGSNGYAWMCKITQNTALNRLRQERYSVTVNLDDCFYLASEEDVEGRSIAAVAVQQAMAQLSPFEQRMVYQKYFMDFTVRDSAASIGKSRSAVARAIASGEEKIRKFLQSETKPQ